MRSVVIAGRPSLPFHVRAVTGVLFAAAALGSALVPTAAGAAAPATGRPGAAYRSGVVCTTASGTSVLAAWKSAATEAPAYPLAPVTAGPDGSRPTSVATDAVTSAPYRGRTGPALAALLARRQPTAAGAATTAAAVERLGGLDPVTTRCLEAGSAGVSTAAVDAAWGDATRLAGPYTVRLRPTSPKIVMGVPLAVGVEVTAASGAPVPGLPVRLDTRTADARLTPAATTTDAAGRARATVTVPTGSSTRAVRVVASVQVPGTPVMMSAPGTVSLVAAGPPRVLAHATRVPVDTTADPQLTPAVDRSLVLPGTVVHPTLAVTGMRGHDGTAQLALRGPLPLHDRDGCRSYAGSTTPPAGGTTATSRSSSPQLPVSGDGTVSGAPITLHRAGCYVLSGEITTSDAVPNVHRTGGRRVITVAPVHVLVAPVGNGMNTAGRLAADVRVTGRVPARLTGVQADLSGPRPSDDGSCASVRLPAAGRPLTVTPARGRLRVTSGSVDAPGCYGFRVRGTVELPGLGSVPLAWSAPAAPPAARTLLIAPSTTVDTVSDGSVTAGGQIGATVTVSGTYAQPGAVRLRLLHLPYDWRGCVGRDWTRADQVDLTGPSRPTTGDGTYRVRSAAVPRSGCWTVVPVLTMDRNPTISVTDTAAPDPTAAFTVLQPAAEPAANRVPLRATASDGTAPAVAAGTGMLALLIIAVGTVLSIALRDRAA